MVKAAGAVPLNADLKDIRVYKDQTESKEIGPWKGYQLGSRCTKKIKKKLKIN